MEFQHAHANRQQHKGYGNGHALTSGVEELLHPVQEPAHDAAKRQRKDDFHNGFYHHSQHADLTVGQSGSNAKGHGKQYQTHSVVDGDHQHQQAGQRAVRLVLANHHQGCCRCGSGSNSAQRNGTGNADHIGEAQVQQNQHHIHHQRGDHRLQNADGDGLCAGGLQLAQAEFVANGECDEAEGCLGNNAQALHLLQRVKAQTGEFQRAKAKRAKQQTCHQISGHRRQIEFFR